MKRHKCLEWTLFVCAALGGLPKVLMKEGISRTLAKREKMNQFRYQIPQKCSWTPCKFIENLKRFQNAKKYHLGIIICF